MISNPSEADPVRQALEDRLERLANALKDLLDAEHEARVQDIKRNQAIVSTEDAIRAIEAHLEGL